jgi:hypothetical protein
MKPMGKKKRKKGLWPRYDIYVRVDEFMGFRDVSLHLFWGEGLGRKAVELLKACKLRPEDFGSDWSYMQSELEQSFGKSEVKALREFFSGVPGYTMSVESHPQPTGLGMGVSALPYGGLTGRVKVSALEGFPLDFDVWGYYDLSGYEPIDACSRCGVAMQGTHAPWCQARDGTPIPDDYVEMMKAVTDCRAALLRVFQDAPDKTALMWAMSELYRDLARLAWGHEEGVEALQSRSGAEEG